MSKGKTFSVVSLFSGCGGLDLGLEGNFTSLGKKFAKQPFHVVWANDINAKACKTMELNFPKTEVVCDDITKVLEHKLKIPKADIVVGGFPCQDFSLAGKRRGLTVQRGQLYLSMAEVGLFVTIRFVGVGRSLVSVGIQDQPQQLTQVVRSP